MSQQMIVASLTTQYPVNGLTGATSSTADDSILKAAKNVRLQRVVCDIITPGTACSLVIETHDGTEIKVINHTTATQTLSRHIELGIDVPSGIRARCVTSASVVEWTLIFDPRG